MGRKTDLFSNFEIMKEHIQGYQKEVDRIRNSDLMTEKAQDEKIGELNSKYEPVIEHLRDDSLSILEAARQSFTKDFKAGTIDRLTDQGYQAGLANVLKMLELKAVDAADFPQIVEAYKYDRAALQAIRAIVQGYDEDRRKEFELQIPGEGRKETERLLDMAAADITEWISLKSLQAGTRNNMQHALNTKYIYEQLNEDLRKEA